MNVFVVGTGRCGTTTFAAACQHATNRTVGHESSAGNPYDFEYPDNHIEVDGPLAFWMRKLRVMHPGCRFVHLVRERSACIASMVRNEAESCRAYGRMLYHADGVSVEDGAAALYDSVNAIVSLYTCFVIRLESVRDQWRDCWNFMELEGDFDRSLEEWNVRHNASS